MTNNLHCPVCSSEALSPETGTRHAGVSWVGEVVFRAVDLVENLFGKQKKKPIRVYANISRARICRNCGYVLLFVKTEELAELKEKWDKLEPFDTSAGLGIED